MGKAQRRKGHDWERDVAQQFRAIFGDEVCRGWQARHGGDASDVMTPCFWVECKVGAKPNPTAALRQAQASCPQGKASIAVCKMDRASPTVTMYFDDFLDLVREWWTLKGR